VLFDWSAAVRRTIAAFIFVGGLAPAAAAAPEIAIIRIGTEKPAAEIIPSEAIGAGVDGHEEGEIERIYAPDSLKEIASIPFHRLSYRLRSELGAAVWHWNEEGTWSDAEHKQGYWISSGKADKPIRATHGYRLPRRGNTHDQANHDGYSRIDDGDEASFWKSNPYLDQHFTGEDNAVHPQWVLADFDDPVEIDVLRILWGEPYATEYEVQYWEGPHADYYKSMEGRWRRFPNGLATNGKGGSELLRLSDAPIRTSYIRILLKKGSGTAPPGSGDIRDRLGFAIRELYAGRLNAKGELKDHIAHAPKDKSQTKILTSSTDPWHRASDRDPKIEQPGLDLVLTSALTRGKPVMIPTGLLYDTPENAAAEIRFLKARGYDVRQIELGEEPDGQYVSPEHYGELFLQFVSAIRAENPSLVMGGPGFQSEVDGWNSIPDEAGRKSWMGRFLDYIGKKNRSADFSFFSFEWYPFDDLCNESPSKQLIEHPELVRQTLARLETDGVPHSIPWVITEYGYSSFAGQREAELPAALLNAEIVAQYLMAGIKTVFHYGIEPNTPIKELDQCETWGNLMALEAGEDGKVRWRLPTYYAAKLVVEEWLGPPDGLHGLYPPLITGAAKDPALAAYWVHRPDGKWALMLLNKDPAKTKRASPAPGGVGEWAGPYDVFQYSPRQFRWQPNRDKGHPVFSNPPEHYTAPLGGPLTLSLPPMSLTVVRAAESRRNP
jgi:F5/8 type C domain